MTDTLTNIFQKLNNSWSRMSQREQRLALIVLVLVGIFGSAWVVQGMRARVRALDSSITLLQDSIINYTSLIARKQKVESAYQRVARQHSSRWTEAEIHDRLRQEIYRLAQKIPPPLNEDGIPVKTTSAGGNLVEIPGLQEGSLHDPEQGYREYMLNFSVPKADFHNFVDFIERLQDSPQSLRVDYLELNRSPLTQDVSANLTITRTIAADATETLQDEGAPELATAEARAMNVADWGCEGGNIEMTGENSTSGNEAVCATATSEEMELFLIRTLPTGSTYDLILDITSTGKGQLAVSDRTGKQIFDGGAQLKSDGRPYRYHIQFTVPDNTGGRMPVRTPLIILSGKGKKVYIDNMIMIKTAG